MQSGLCAGLPVVEAPQVMTDGLHSALMRWCFCVVASGTEV